MRWANRHAFREYTPNESGRVSNEPEYQARDQNPADDTHNQRRFLRRASCSSIMISVPCFAVQGVYQIGEV